MTLNLKQPAYLVMVVVLLIVALIALLPSDGEGDEVVVAPAPHDPACTIDHQYLRLEIVAVQRVVIHAVAILALPRSATQLHTLHS